LDSNRKTAVIVGVLFITATVSAVVSGLLTGPVLDDPDYLINVSANENQVLIAALLELFVVSIKTRSSIHIRLGPYWSHNVVSIRLVRYVRYL